MHDKRNANNGPDRKPAELGARDLNWRSPEPQQCNEDRRRAAASDDHLVFGVIELCSARCRSISPQVSARL